MHPSGDTSVRENVQRIDIKVSWKTHIKEKYQTVYQTRYFLIPDVEFSLFDNSIINFQNCVRT